MTEANANELESKNFENTCTVFTDGLNSIQYQIYLSNLQSFYLSLNKSELKRQPGEKYSKYFSNDNKSNIPKYLIPIYDPKLFSIDVTYTKFWIFESSIRGQKWTENFYKFFNDNPDFKTYFWTVTFSNMFCGLIDDYHQLQAVSVIEQILNYPILDSPIKNDLMNLKEEFKIDSISYFIWHNRVFQYAFQSAFYMKLSQNQNSDNIITLLGESFNQSLNRLTIHQINLFKKYFPNLTNIETRKKLFQSIIVRSVSIWKFSKVFINSELFHSTNDNIYDQLNKYLSDPQQDIFFGDAFNQFMDNPSYYHPIPISESLQVHLKLKIYAILSELDLMILIQIIGENSYRTGHKLSDKHNNFIFKFDTGFLLTKSCRYVLLERHVPNIPNLNDKQIIQNGFISDNPFGYALKCTTEISDAVNRLYFASTFDESNKSNADFETYLNDTVFHDYLFNMLRKSTKNYKRNKDDVRQHLNTIMFPDAFHSNIDQLIHFADVQEYKAPDRSTMQRFMKLFDIVAHGLLFAYLHNKSIFNIDKTRFQVVNFGTLHEDSSVEPFINQPIWSFLAQIMNKTVHDMFPNNAFNFLTLKLENTKVTNEFHISDNEMMIANCYVDSIESYDVNEEDLAKSFTDSLAMTLTTYQIPNVSEDEEETQNEVHQRSNNDIDSEKIIEKVPKNYGSVDIGSLYVSAQLMNDLFNCVSDLFDANTLLKQFYYRILLKEPNVIKNQSSIDTKQVPIDIMQGPISLAEAINYAEKTLKSLCENTLFDDVYQTISKFSIQFAFEDL